MMFTFLGRSFISTNAVASYFGKQ